MIYPKIKCDLVKSMYEQLWENQRAGVKERLHIVYIFSGILTGSLAFLKYSSFDKKVIPLIIFIMFLSIFLVFLTLKIDFVLKARETAADNIVKQFEASDLLPIYPNHWIKNISIGRLFPIFFMLCFCFLLFLLLILVIGSSILIYSGSLIISGGLFLITSFSIWNAKYDVKS